MADSAVIEALDFQDETHGTGRRLNLVPFDQIRLRNDRRDLVKGLIPRVGLTVVWGPPKSGKSFWTFDVAMHVALGWEYRSRRVHQGAVCYCAFEGQVGLEARVEAFRQRHLAEHEGDVPFFLEPSTLDLVGEHQELIEAIREQMAETLPVMIVLDTLNRSLRGSESSDEDMSSYVKAADALRETFQCAVIVVHHCGVDATRPRGHTSLTGAVDAQLAIKKDAADNIIAECELSKDGPRGETMSSRLEVVQVGTDEDGEPIASCVIVESDGPPSREVCKMPASAQTAFELLQKAIDEAGETPPGSVTNGSVPAAVRAVPVSLWRDFCFKGTVTGSDNPNSKRQAFSRALKRLRQNKAIGVRNDWVWIAG